MNQLIWAAMREYVQAEVKLAVEEYRYMAATPEVRDSHLEPLRLLVTRFETEVRRLINAQPAPVQPLDEAQLRAINSMVPYGVEKP